MPKFFPYAFTLTPHPSPLKKGPTPHIACLRLQPARGRYATGLAHRSAAPLGGASGGLRPPPLRIARPGPMLRITANAIL